MNNKPEKNVTPVKNSYKTMSRLMYMVSQVKTASKTLNGRTTCTKERIHFQQGTGYREYGSQCRRTQTCVARPVLLKTAAQSCGVRGESLHHKNYRYKHEKALILPMCDHASLKVYNNSQFAPCFIRKMVLAVSSVSQSEKKFKRRTCIRANKVLRKCGTYCGAYRYCAALQSQHEGMQDVSEATGMNHNQASALL